MNSNKIAKIGIIIILLGAMPFVLYDKYVANAEAEEFKADTTERIYEGETDLEKDVRAYVDNVSEYYYYNKSNIGVFLTEQRLKKEGGVCWHYAKQYQQMAMQDNYFSKVERFFGESKIGHDYIRIWSPDMSGYCVVDQLYYNCWRLG